MKETIQLRYFAQLAEQRGLGAEEIPLPVGRTAQQIYLDLQYTHGFTLSQAILRPAINGQYADWDQQLDPGDELAFIPPVAGG
jgi:molybdopterin synthase sulfur carrier subunit